MRIELDIPISVEEILQCTEGRLCADICESQQINAICTDTRECQKDDLFIALKGEIGRAHV